ncbi:MAG: choice-of-anchor Q domain-containing protein, partial [Chthoniobacterales bacterium]
MESRALFRLLIGSGLILLAAHPVQSTCPPNCGIAYTVDSTGDGGNVGTATQCNDGTGHCTLRAAIQASNLHVGDDGIFFDIPTTDPGYNAGTWTINLLTPLPFLSTNIAITGPGAGMLIVRPESHVIASSFHVFDVTATDTVSITALTISNGIGAGIQNQGTATVTITDARVSNNGGTGSNGGGVLNTGTGHINIDRCTISNNRVANGGGVYNNSTAGEIDITSSTVSGNAAMSLQGSSSGGGIFNNGTVYVINSSVSGNSATGGYDSSSNVAGKASGGGIFNSSGAAITITNSTFSGNSATGGNAPAGGTYTGGTSFGGGVGNAGTLHLQNSTLSNNHAVGGTSGGALPPAASVGGGMAGPGTNNIRSSIVALNTATSSGPDVNDTFISEGFNLIGQRNGSSGFTAATDQTGTVASPLDPQLDPAGLKANGGPTQTIALLFGSPALDKGIAQPSFGHPTDQRGLGYSRIVDDPSVPNAVGGDGTDIGAFEVGAQIDAVSRKTHGAFIGNISLPLFGPTLGIECRTGGASGDHQLVLTFASAVTVNGSPQAQVISGTGQIGTGGTANGGAVTVNGAVVTVPVTNIGNAQRIMVKLSGVSDGTNVGEVIVPMGVLVGDITGNGTVNASDVGQTKSFSGQTTDATNFRADLNLSGTINASDIG